MELLVQILLIISSSFAVAAPLTGPCPSHENFQVAWEFLASQKDIGINDRLKLDLARKVAAGCDSAGVNFKKIFTLLNESGVSNKVTLESALEFSSLGAERAESFIAIFQALYLEKKLDLDFKSSWKIARELSKDAKGSVKIITDDFLKISDFCLSDKGLALSLKYCGEVAISMARMSYLYPEGLFNDMKTTFDLIRNHKRIGLSQKDSLGFLPKILKGGPGSVANFQQNLDYATSDKMNLPPAQALSLATEIAGYSLRKEP